MKLIEERHLTGAGYVAVWAALLGLTLLSFLLSLANLGTLDIVLALAIAVTKSTLVALFFMHLIEERFANGLALIMGVLLIVLLVSLTAADVATRTTFPKAPVPPSRPELPL